MQPGDTFYKIALANNLPLSELLAVNAGIDPYKLMIGQMIQLPKHAQPTKITVSAAASLQNSLIALQKYYALRRPAIRLAFNFGASGALQQQIEQGAPVDLFISAGKAQMDALEQKHLLINESRIDLLGNDLVLISRKDHGKVTSLEDLTKATVSRISIGAPQSVPAGQYAQESLMRLNLWDSIQPKLVLGKDVTSVLNYVETGNADAGFVYHTDAQGSTQVKIVAVIPSNSHKPIVYPAAVISTTKNKQAAEDFLNYLQSSDAQRVFASYGFKT
ncbi:MAG: molybdate ABC transporter substrate-binding protein [Desulfosporosinus sp.]|nr:molybdate ABC transporter substrate-binding protein [Desulfosporosinus sp.]